MAYPSRGVKYAHTPKSTPIYINHHGRNVCVGQVVGSTFTKHVQATRHFLRKPHAICLDAQNIVDAECAGATSVHVIDSETNRTYIASFEHFKSKCFRVQRGDGQQLGLTLDQWSVDGQQPAAERQAEVQVTKAEAASMQQLDLFGVA